MNRNEAPCGKTVVRPRSCEGIVAVVSHRAARNNLAIDAKESYGREVRRRALRRGMSSLEVVMATAVALPLAALMFFLGVRICRYVYGVISGLTTWPFL